MKLKRLWGGTKTISVAALAFVAGALAWAAGTGAVAGILDMYGIILPGPLLVKLSPVAGVVAAAYVSGGSN